MDTPTTPNLHIVKIPHDTTPPLPELPCTALMDLYQRLERTLYDWHLDHAQEIAEWLPVGRYTETLIEVMAQALVDAVSHLEPADRHTYRLYAEQMGSKLISAILDRLKSQDHASS
jgi:hypothetical protein